MLKITVLNGPNLNLLGVREPGIYGSVTLGDIEDNLRNKAKQTTATERPVSLEFFQSNREYELVEKIQQLITEKNHWIILNPAAFTHTSIAIRDALLATKIPFVEVHLSNIYAREDFRKKSWFSDIATGTISGLGAKGYELAFDYIIETHT